MYKSGDIQDDTLCVLKLGCDQFCFKEWVANFINDSLFPLWDGYLLPSLPTRLYAAVKAGPGPGRLDSVLSAGYNSQPPSIVNFVLTQSKPVPTPPAFPMCVQLSLVPSPGECRMSRGDSQQFFPPHSSLSLPPSLFCLSVCVWGTIMIQKMGQTLKNAHNCLTTPVYNKWVNNTKAVLLNIYYPFVDSIISPRGWHYCVTTCDCVTRLGRTLLLLSPPQSCHRGSWLPLCPWLYKF